MSPPPPLPPDPNAPLSGSASFVSRAGLTAIIWTCFSASTMVLFTRLFLRWHQNRFFLPDDYLMMWAWACMLTMTILQTQQMNVLWYMAFLSAGRIALDPEEVETQTYQLTRWQFPIIKLFWITLWSVKASFLATFYRIIQSFRILRILWYCVAVFAALALIGCIVASTLTCSPPSDYFGGACSSPHEIWMQRFNVIYSTTVDIMTDLMIMGLPIAALPSLRLGKGRKIGLGLIFALGIVIICIAIVRMTQVIVGESVDLIGLAIWGAVETATAVVVGSLPALKSFLERIIRRYCGTKKLPTDQDSDVAINRGDVLCVPLDERQCGHQLEGGSM